MLVRNLHASVLRFCSDFAETHGLTSVNFDAHADDSSLPPGDVVGMSGLSWDVDDEILSVNVLFGITTQEDTNLFKLIEKMDLLFDLLLPTKLIPAYDADTGERIGEFVVRNGTKALPVQGTEARPLQFVMVGLVSTVTFNQN
jgi:hypothetical protein